MILVYCASFGSAVQLALPDTPETDVPGVMDGLKMGFLPVPQLMQTPMV